MSRTTTLRRTALVVAGLALTGAGVAGFAGTAEAAAPAGAPASHTQNWGGGWGWGNDDDDNERVAGVYRNYGECRWRGERGERWGAWEDYDCDYVSTGWNGGWDRSWGWDGGWRHRGVWVLRVDDCD